MHRIILIAVGLIACATAPALGQYPSVPADVAADAARAKRDADQRSDQAWAAALPVVRDGAKRGKPYIPWASHPLDLKQATIPAFPGAWGGGMYSFGGRGGKVYVVSSLADSGPGTFREACEAGGPRIVVFNVAGIIQLQDRIRIRAPYITIAGQTAPGDGVCIAGNTVELETHDVVIRHMRFRRGATGVGDRNDAIGGNPIGNIMIDHVSASWGLDENMSMYRHMYHLPDDSPDWQNPLVQSRFGVLGLRRDADTPVKLPTVNITIQNSIFSEGLDTYNHAFGSTLGGRNSTFHHNLWACNTGRNPSVGMDGDFALVNNVLFNWRHRTVDGGDHNSRYNIINNYYKPGPATPTTQPIAHRILKPESRRSKTIHNDYGKAYVAGNHVAGNESVSADNWAGGVQLDEEVENPPQYLEKIRVEHPFSVAPLPIEPAEAAYENVLAAAGALFPTRDPVDQRVVEMVRSGEVTHGNGIITDVEQVGGYPEYAGEPRADKDSDGMPDAWEVEHGLNPDDPSDAAGDVNGDGYTNIEKYINGIDTAASVDWTDLRNNVDTLRAAPHRNIVRPAANP